MRKIKTQSILDLLNRLGVAYKNPCDNLYAADKNDYTLSWIDQDGIALGCKLTHYADQDDAYSGYVGGFFFTGLQQIRDKFKQESWKTKSPEA